MAEEKNKWIDVVAKLIKLTQDGKIKWQVSSGAASALKKDATDTIEAAFTTLYKKQRLRIYRRFFNEHTIEAPIFTSGSTFLSAWGPPTEKEVRRSEVYLEFINDFDLAIWTYPTVSNLSDLLSAIQYQVAGVKSFVDDILNEES